MIHCHVAVYKVSFAQIRVNSRQLAVDSSSNHALVTSPGKMIRAGGLDRLEQHNRECTRIARELARMSSLYNAQNASVIEGDDSLPCGRLQSFIRANSRQFASIRGPLLVQLALGSKSKSKSRRGARPVAVARDHPCVL